MDDATARNHGHNAWTKRYRAIDDDEISSTALRKLPSIGKSGSPRGRCGNQVPGLRERQHVIGGKSERRQKLRR
jgi:hypothetical protein